MQFAGQIRQPARPSPSSGSVDPRRGWDRSDTRFPFLSFSIYDRGWGCSWNSRGVAIPPMHDEAKIFDKLFGEEDLIIEGRIEGAVTLTGHLVVAQQGSLEATLDVESVEVHGEVVGDIVAARAIMIEKGSNGVGTAPDCVSEQSPRNTTMSGDESCR